MNDANQLKVREPYEAPTIEDVPVRADEQILIACKVAGVGGGQDPVFCFTCSSPTAS
jgi:hypothetical protein